MNERTEYVTNFRFAPTTQYELELLRKAAKAVGMVPVYRDGGLAGWSRPEAPSVVWKWEPFERFDHAMWLALRVPEIDLNAIIREAHDQMNHMARIERAVCRGIIFSAAHWGAKR